MRVVVMVAVVVVNNNINYSYIDISIADSFHKDLMRDAQFFGDCCGVRDNFNSLELL